MHFKIGAFLLLLAKGKHYLPLPFLLIVTAQSLAAEKSETAAHPTHSEVQIEAGLAWREASMRWSIASDVTGTATPNVLSALAWEDVVILDAFCGLEWRLPNHLFARVDGTLGNPVSGDMVDSDYAGDNRTQEIRRSRGKVSGQRAAQGSVEFGKYWSLGSRWQTLTALGAGFSTLEVNNEQGYLLLDVANPGKTGSFGGLDSDYNAYWTGAWARLGFYYTTRPWQASLSWTVIPQAHYDATARWNMRSDLAQPKSFDQDAGGDGERLELRLGREILPSQWVVLVVRTEQWQAEHGNDRLYRPGVNPSLTRLNDVQMENAAAGLQWMRVW